MHRLLVDGLIYSFTLVIVAVLGSLIVYARLFTHYTELQLTW